MRAAWASVGLMLIGCSAEGPPSLVLRVSSDLAIAEETNNLGVRVRADGAALDEGSYTLGEGERAAWPQTLPIVAGARHPKRIDVALELRWAQPGAPSAVVGYQEVSVDFPDRGTVFVNVDVPRACVDEDRDGFGIGFGCDKPDCDDADPEVPLVRFCGSPPPTDAGVPPDSGARPDAGQIRPDAGFDDAGMPRDAGPRPDGGGRPDAGPRPDGGGLFDAGPSELCGGRRCAPDEECFMDRCAKRCQDNRDCDAIHLACLERWGVCICRVPCAVVADCGPFQCVDGCCQL